VKLNRTQLTISGILLTLALILAIYFSRKPADPLSGKADSNQSIRELLAQPVNIRAAVDKAGATLPAPCPGLFARITEGTVEEFTKFTDDEKNSLHSCSEALPILAKHDPAHVNKLRNSCITPDEEGSNAMQSNCALYFYFYKAGLVAFFQKDKALTDLTTDELALIFYHEYNNLDPKRLDALSGIADELVRRVPSFSVKKAKASIAFFQFMQQPGPGKGDELRRMLGELKDQNPHDEQLLELHFVALAIMNDLKQMNELTENFVKDHPSSAAGFYIRSAYFWQIKDRAKTIETLKNAIALEPNNARYTEAQDRVQTAEPAAPGVYDVNVNFDLLSE
jgi:tetratricopeptide (TPR) repeat protein